MIVGNALQGVANVYSSQQPLATQRINKAEAVGKQDAIVLSREAQNFSGILRELHGISDVRQDKVDFYSGQIAAGNYNVSSDNLALSMIGSRF